MTRAEQGSRNDGKIRQRRAVVERYVPWQNPLPLRQGEARRGDESGTDEVSEAELRLVFWKTRGIAYALPVLQPFPSNFSTPH